MVWMARLRYMDLQGACAAKRTDGEEHKQQSHGDRNANEPEGDVAGPRAERGIQPAESENGKHGADRFVEELFQYAPKPAKSARLRRASRPTRGGGHIEILTQNRKQLARRPGPEDRVNAL